MDDGKNKQREKDGLLWQVVTADVTPLSPPKRKKAASTTTTPPAQKNTRPKMPAAPVTPLPAAAPVKAAPVPSLPLPEQPLRMAPAPTPVQNAEPSVDRRTEQRFARGQMPIEAVLDLHGHSQDEAYDALKRFVHSGRASNMRCVLVVTGKGRMGTGVLRRRVPEWLQGAEFSQSILRVRAAKQNHGGDGALYILLRRNRD